MSSNIKPKSNAKEAPTEPFKRAVGVCLRAIAGKGDVEVATLKRCIKAGTISGAFRPVLCGTGRLFVGNRARSLNAPAGRAGSGCGPPWASCPCRLP